LYSLLRTTAASGVAVLVCSSDEQELADLCHRVLVLRDGEIATELTGAELTAVTLLNWMENQHD
jgi:ribose transport system ATP-binding protein